MRFAIADPKERLLGSIGQIRDRIREQVRPLIKQDRGPSAAWKLFFLLVAALRLFLLARAVGIPVSLFTATGLDFLSSGSLPAPEDPGQFT
jgi:hypothetical protein